MSKAVRLALVVLAAASLSLALPGIQRVPYSTKHFTFSVATADTVELRAIAPMAETIWDSLAHITGFEPPVPVSVAIRDEDDYSNGWAVPFQDWVSIWLAPLDFEFRDGTRWRANVLAHELSHVFTMRALGFTSHWLGHDLGVTSGRARTDASADIGISSDLESWLAEGLAQYGAERCGVDRYDPQRAMLERVAWLSGAIMPYPLLVSFFGDMRESELTYNQGYSFVRFTMSHGHLDLANLLRAGREAGIRTAVERSFGKPFAEVFEAWRADLRTRYGEPDPAKTKLESWLALPYRLEYEHAASPVRFEGQRFFLSSHANDYGMTELYVADSTGDVSQLDSRVEGRLHLDRAGKRLLYVRMSIGLDHRQIRDLWALDLDSGKSGFMESRQLTENARVVDACAGSTGTWVIGRSDGANRLLHLQGTTLQRELDSPSGLELMSVAEGSGGVLYVGAMGVGGYSLYRHVVGSGKLERILPTVEARDPVVDNGTLYFSAVTAGRWQIARIAEAELGVATPELLTNEVGGAFQPFVADGRLDHVAYGTQGFVPRQQAISPLGPLPMEPSPGVASATLPPKAGVAATAQWGSGNPFSILGFATQTSIYSVRPAPGDSVALGDKLLFGGALYLIDRTMENQAVLQVQGLSGLGGTWGRGPIDPMLQASWQSESFTPYVMLDASYMQVSPEFGNSVSSAELDTLYPAVTTISVSAQLSFTLTDHVSLVALAAKQNNALTLGSASLVLLDQDLVLGGVVLGKSQPGRYGTLSGATLSLVGGYVDISGLSEEQDTSTYLVNLAMKPQRGLVAFPSLALATNLYRSVLLDGTLGATLLSLDTVSSVSYQVSGNLGFPLGRGHVSIPLGSRHLTLLDPILRLGFTGVNRSKQQVQATSGLRLDPGRLRADRFQARPDLSHPISLGASPSSAPMPWSAARTKELALNASIEVGVLTLSQSTSGWALGVSVPLDSANRLGRPTWQVSLSF